MTSLRVALASSLLALFAVACVGGGGAVSEGATASGPGPTSGAPAADGAAPADDPHGVLDPSFGDAGVAPFRGLAPQIAPSGETTYTVEGDTLERIDASGNHDAIFAVKASASFSVVGYGRLDDGSYVVVSAKDLYDSTPTKTFAVERFPAGGGASTSRREWTVADRCVLPKAFVAPDASVVVACQWNTKPSVGDKATVVRTGPDGAPRAGFGVGGFAKLEGTDTTYLLDVRFRPDGRPLWRRSDAGTIRELRDDGTLARDAFAAVSRAGDYVFEPSGALLSVELGTNGTLLVARWTGGIRRAAFQDDTGERRIAVDGLGLDVHIARAGDGALYVGSSAGEQPVLVRVTAGGDLDPSFGKAGYAVLPRTLRGGLQNLAVDAAGRLYAVLDDPSGTGSTVARILP